MGHMPVSGCGRAPGAAASHAAAVGCRVEAVMWLHWLIPAMLLAISQLDCGENQCSRVSNLLQLVWAVQSNPLVTCPLQRMQPVPVKGQP